MGRVRALPALGLAVATACGSGAAPSGHRDADTIRKLIARYRVP